MPAELYWIPTSARGRMAIMPRPRGGDWLEDEIASWQRAGVDVVVSLLTQPEIDHFDLGHEGDLCSAHGVKFLAYPFADRGVPDSIRDFGQLIEQLAQAIREGRNVAIHCRQGIGRSAVVATSVLIALGVEAEAAIHQVSRQRGCPVPETPEQRRWILEFAALRTRQPEPADSPVDLGNTLNENRTVDHPLSSLPAT